MTRLIADRLGRRIAGSTILEDVSLSFETGQSVALIGPNGAGKSSLLKLLAGVERPQSGTILYDGKDLQSLSLLERARRIGYVPQFFAPFWDHLVSDLLMLGAGRLGPVPAGDVDKLAREHELEHLLGRHWSTLSGGERARVLLAAITAVRPLVLLADEPGASLDIRHRLDLLTALTTRRRDGLTIVALHDLDLAFRFFDRVIVLAQGRIVADGAASAVMTDPELDAAFGVCFERLKVEDWHTLFPARVL